MTTNSTMKLWRTAFANPAEMGLYGDFLYSEASRHGGGGLAAMAGPVAGLVEDMIGLTQGNLVQMAQGKDTRFGAELVKFGKGMTPMFSSLWYTKTAVDHLFFQQLQNELSPGYLQAMRSRAMREFGDREWWATGEAAPSRMPNLGAAVGED